MKFDLIAWITEHIVIIDGVIAMMILLAMLHVSIKSEYKGKLGMWIESFLIGFVAFCLFTTIFYTVPSILLKPIDINPKHFLAHVGVLGVCFSYFAMCFYTNLYGFTEDTKTGIRLNQWLESKRLHKDKLKKEEEEEKLQ